MKKETFKDTSIFNGISQYTDDYGIKWRIEDEGNFLKFYEEQGNCFRYVNEMKKRKNESLKSAHYRFLKQNPLVQ